MSAIRIRGDVPDGTGDCKDGENDLAVVVKNAGAESKDDNNGRTVETTCTDED